ncbi:biotin transporter BioY [Arthrobacter gandavensis]|uniref:biotin transporter BioY n=1 Tax=Arthrobacter gandavensis TaxID=169960 RepID=UPI0018900A92|nr:biotin transporter BioY [Arthrobacter gandavensis]MBF4995138.1 biotin transporter BioY [Arthrobacter gandavensis]
MSTAPEPAATSLPVPSPETSASSLPSSRETGGGSSGAAPRAASRRRWGAADLSYIAVFAALIAAFSLVPGIPLAAGVPITLQTLAVTLAGMVLGPARGAAAVGLYLAAGLAGLPVFSGFTSGVGVLARPSAGYLLSFPLAALVVGLLVRVLLGRIRRVRFAVLFAAGLGTSFLVVHPLGIAGLMLNAKLSFPAALTADMAFWPGDVLKNLAAAAVAVSVFAAFPRLAPRMKPRRTRAHRS